MWFTERNPPLHPFLVRLHHCVQRERLLTVLDLLGKVEYMSPNPTHRAPPTPTPSNSQSEQVRHCAHVTGRLSFGRLSFSSHRRQSLSRHPDITSRPADPHNSPITQIVRMSALFVLEGEIGFC